MCKTARLLLRHFNSLKRNLCVNLSGSVKERCEYAQQYSINKAGVLLITISVSDSFSELGRMQAETNLQMIIAVQTDTAGG